MTAPIAKSFAMFGYNPVANSCLMYGGLGLTTQDNIAWEFSVTNLTWGRAPLVTSGGPDAGYQGAAFCYDNTRHKFYMFSGRRSDISEDSKLWSYDPATAAWSTLLTSGPNRREGACMAYQANRDRCVMFGGQDTTITGTSWTDTQEYNPTTNAWGLKTVVTTPPVRAGASMAYNPVNNLVYMVGGLSNFSGSTPTARTDTWSYDGTNWTLINNTLPVTSSNAFLSSLAYSPTHGTMMYIVVGVVPTVYLLIAGSWVSQTSTHTPHFAVGGSMNLLSTADSVILIGNSFDPSRPFANPYKWNGTDWVDLGGLSGFDTVPTMFLCGNLGGHGTVMVMDATTGVQLNSLDDPTFDPDAGGLPLQVQFNQPRDALIGFSSREFTLSNIIEWPTPDTGDIGDSFGSIRHFIPAVGGINYEPSSIAIATESKRVYMCTQSSSDTFPGVSVFDLISNTIVDTINILDTTSASDLPIQIAYDVDANQLWTIGGNSVTSIDSSGLSQTISCIDPFTGTVLMRFPGYTSGPPYGFVFDAYNHLTYVLNGSALSVMNITTINNLTHEIINTATVDRSITTLLPCSLGASGALCLGSVIANPTDGTILFDFEAFIADGGIVGPIVDGSWYDPINLRYITLYRSDIYTIDPNDSYAVTLLTSIPSAFTSGGGPDTFNPIVPFSSTPPPTPTEGTGSLAGTTTLRRDPSTGIMFPNHGTIDGGTVLTLQSVGGTWDDFKTFDALSPYITGWWLLSNAAASDTTGTTIISSGSESSLRFITTSIKGNFSVIIDRPQISSPLPAQDIILASFGVYADSDDFARLEVFANQRTPPTVRFIYCTNGVVQQSATITINNFPLTLKIVRINSAIFAQVGSVELPPLLGWSTVPTSPEIRVSSTGSGAPTVSTRFRSYIDTPMLIYKSTVMADLTGPILPPAMQFITRRGHLATTIPISLHMATFDLDINNWIYDDDDSLVLANDGGQLLSLVNDPTLRQ